ncbi:SH3 domain-containing protein [Entomomonas sp. E2T0]|uniref:SH3 domain-containing protein n=1 Tax=Entomomonas sp. E2T0 TaxID=2930213 RepID=UPI00222852DF|nr:SH3 domain-containing protein [Entomomonas sp. E2T0]UYZ85313.1 SH3 domain-containing protein [Entomomonas sp. E2T0]
MDKELEHPINHPWPESIKRLQELTKFTSLPFFESETMRSIQKLNEAATNNLTSLATRQSGLMKLAQLAAENNKLAFAWRESTAIKLAGDLAKSNKFASLALQTPEVISSLKMFVEATKLSGLYFQQPEAVKHLENFSKTFQLPSIAKSQIEVLKQFSEISNLASFKALTNLKNSPLFNRPSVDCLSNISPEQIIDKSFLEIDSQIREEVLSTTDFNTLSEKTKNILTYLYHYYFLPFFLSCLVTHMMTQSSEVRKELEHVSTPAEAKAFVRSYSKSSDWLSLKGYRVTIADSLNFRSRPSTKSEVITTLPIGTLVEVIDKKTYRSWLLVEVEINGEFVQGWVSRRYTDYFRY